MKHKSKEFIINTPFVTSWRVVPPRLARCHLGAVSAKTGGSLVGGPDLCVKADSNRRQGTQMFTQVQALLMEAPK